MLFRSLKLVERLGGLDAVVPFAVPVVCREGEGGELLVGDFDASGVMAFVACGSNGEPGVGGCRRDQFNDCAV